MIRNRHDQPGAFRCAGALLVPELQRVRCQALPPYVQRDIVKQFKDEACSGNSSVAGSEAWILETFHQREESTCKERYKQLHNHNS